MSDMDEDDVSSVRVPHASPSIRPPPARRQRIMQSSIDQNLIGTRVMRTEEIKLKELLNENVEMEKSLNKTHVNLQILRIITPQAGNTGNAMTRYHGGNQQQRINFIRIILCRNDKDLCYIMMTSDMNKRLFHRDLMLRDNGTITIGSYLRLLAPHPIERNMQGIPLIKSFYPIIAMDSPSIINSIAVNNYIEGNQSGVAVLKNTEIFIRRTTPIQTSCSGKHCDKQRPTDWAFTVNRGCGCWGTTSLGTSNIALMHNIVITSSGSEGDIKVQNFSSTNFNSLFMDRPIPPNTSVTALEQTDASAVLEDAIEECVEFINDNGGFQVILWYSRGEINDQSLVGLNAQEDAQVDAGKMNYHVVQILPLNVEFKQNGSELMTELIRKKFRVGQNF